MIDIGSLPLYSKMILFIGFGIGFVSFVLLMKYPIMLILMKLSPEYRKFVKKTLALSKVKQKSRF